MAYKVIKWLIIPFFAILLMSHNASAIEPVFDISNYDLVYDQINPNYTYTYNDNFSETISTAKLNSSRNQLLSIMYPAFSYSKGDIVQTDFIIYDNGSTFTTGQTASGSLTGAFPLPYINFSSDYSILDVQELVFHDINKMINYYQSISCRAAGTGTSCETYPEISTSSSYYQVFRITFKIKKNSLPLYNITLNSSTTFPLFDFSSWNFNYDIRIKPTRWNVWRPIQTKQEEAADKEIESSENIENQTPSDTPGGDNQSATNLIGNISGIFNQIANIPVGSSCSIDANFGNLDLGNLNLCTGKDKMPFIVNFGATVFQLVFVVSTGLILVRQVLSLYDWSRK